MDRQEGANRNQASQGEQAVQQKLMTAQKRFVRRSGGGHNIPFKQSASLRRNAEDLTRRIHNCRHPSAGGEAASIQTASW
jgi:hypothetical protein